MILNLKTSRKTHKKQLTSNIQTNENKKEILNTVNSTIRCTRHSSYI